MNLIEYDITQRRRDTDPWQWQRTCTNRADAIERAEALYQQAGCRISVAVVAVDRETRERTIYQRWERNATGEERC